MPKRRSSDENDDDEFRRTLRKRQPETRRASLLAAPQICRFQHCGIQLKEGDSLAWHYEGHLAREMEKLDKIRVRTSSVHVEDRKPLERLRYEAFGKIRFRRESRKALPTTSRTATSGNFRCPVCDLRVSDDEFTDHVDACLRVTKVDEDEEPHRVIDDDSGSEEGSNFDEYEWAGQRRVRAIALLEGGGDSFMTVVRGTNEDEVLDIEGDGRRVGPSQYSDADLVFPEAETPQERVERDSLLSLLGHNKTSTEEEEEKEDEVDIESTETDDLKRKVNLLEEENESLRGRTVCNVCMDAYEKPLVSLECWHVHCEQCWLRALGTKKLCPQCKVITRPEELRKIYL